MENICILWKQAKKWYCARGVPLQVFSSTSRVNSGTEACALVTKTQPRHPRQSTHHHQSAVHAPSHWPTIVPILILSLSSPPSHPWLWSKHNSVSVKNLQIRVNGCHWVCIWAAKKMNMFLFLAAPTESWPDPNQTTATMALKIHTWAESQANYMVWAGWQRNISPTIQTKNQPWEK